ncbi:hypothetical protein [Rickettsia asembonensis]|nr:hypothetical protein [Rickettsia asembonensis]WCR57025.1 MAG: hypothetical protein PG979_001082 [Rickettsia asembonensis]
MQFQDILKQLLQTRDAFNNSEEKNLNYEIKLNNTITELNNALEEIKILKNKLIISEEEKSIFLKFYRKFK